MIPRTENHHRENADSVDGARVARAPDRTPSPQNECRERRPGDQAEKTGEDFARVDLEIDQPQGKSRQRQRRHGVGRDHHRDGERRVEFENGRERDRRTDHGRRRHQNQPLFEAGRRVKQAQRGPREQRRRDHVDGGDRGESRGALGICPEPLDVQTDHRHRENDDDGVQDDGTEQVRDRRYREAGDERAGHQQRGPVGDRLEAAADQ